MNATQTDDLLTVHEMQQALPFAGKIYGSESLETFLTVNAADIPPRFRATIHQYILQGRTRAATELIPDYLQDAFRGILEQMYRERVAGQKVNPKAEVMPTPGKPDSRMAKHCRL